MELKEKLAALRVEKGLSQAELAEALDVSRQAISRWEVGTSVPSMENLMRLSKLYEVPLDAFACGREEAAQPEEVAIPARGDKGRTWRLVKNGILAACAVALIILIVFAATRKEEPQRVQIGTMEKEEQIEISSAGSFHMEW